MIICFVNCNTQKNIGNISFDKSPERIVLFYSYKINSIWAISFPKVITFDYSDTKNIFLETILTNMVIVLEEKQ